MFNSIAPVGHIHRHPVAFGVAAFTTMTAVTAVRRYKEWKLFFTDAEAFDAKYPPVQ